MRHISVFVEIYEPDTAFANRLWGFLKGFSKNEVSVDVFFISPNNRFDKVKQSIPNVCFHYLWRRGENKYLACLRKLWVTRRAHRYLRPNDNVILYGVPQLVPSLVKQSGVRVYHERTEHPDVVPFPRFLGKDRYYSACTKLDGLFVITTTLRDFFVNKGVDPDAIHIINMTVDKDRFNNLTKDFNKGKYIAYCGTASNNKDGVDTLIKSFAIVANRIKDVKLYIIGKTPSKEDESGNFKLIDELGIKDRIVFLGVLPSISMPQVLKDAEVLALARPDSLQARCGFATKVGEYLLTENPVVLTNVGDFHLFLKDHVSALFVEPNNPEQFANKLEWALTHSMESSSIGKKGAEVAMACFDSDIQSKKVLDIIFENT